jgi:hypothetical protein
MKKHRGVYAQPDRSGVLITQHAFEAMWEDAEIAKAVAKVPVGWTLRRVERGWEVIDPQGEDHSGGEETLYMALYMAGFAEEV